MPPLSPEERLQKAYEVALPWLEKELDRRAVIGVGDVRAAALRGLIAHGIEKTADIDAVTERFMARRACASTAQDDPLYWQEAEEPRQAKLTTALHVSQEQDVHHAGEGGGRRPERRAQPRPGQARAIGDSRASALSGQEQLEAIHRLGEGGRLGVLIGAAGIGKTTCLQPLVSAWQAGQARCPWHRSGLATGR